jgi:hypothetical protein
MTIHRVEPEDEDPPNCHREVKQFAHFSDLAVYLLAQGVSEQEVHEHIDDMIMHGESAVYFKKK